MTKAALNFLTIRKEKRIILEIANSVDEDLKKSIWFLMTASKLLMKKCIFLKNHFGDILKNKRIKIKEII